ncbi:hypothetical protein D9611_003021 [Ephemerocybe angulata]|uniref:MYND-type domain-containing protein n=1 Tax=Ephemerocybe angulata TaxID=980116 RepID=A0A8H5C855_9AGAR|nr:hypothetical protein D9611_003021 [Tulosesus angulatus]
MLDLFADQFSQMNYLMSVINDRPQDSMFCLERLTDLSYHGYLSLESAHQGGCCNTTCLPKASVVHAQKCSNCQLMRYCDTKCQKEAWSNQQYPHKSICPKIKSLRERLGPSAWARATTSTPDFTFTDFKRVCQRKKIDMEILKEVGTHLACLQAFQMIYRDKNSA